MVKVKRITKKQYKGTLYDITLKNDKSPYFFANGILTHNSLYPHLMIQCNLYGRKKQQSDRPVWNGGGVWKVEGEYYADELSLVGKLLKKLYNDRLVYKKNRDKREYTNKIVLNTIYGILNNSYYTLVHDSIAGGDCTRLGRQWIKYVRKCFRDNGYIIIYSDTDSIFLQDPFIDKEKLFRTKDNIIMDIQKTVPFPQQTFNMVLEEEIKYMYFFKGKTNEKDSDTEMDEEDLLKNKAQGLLKKNYVIITKDDKVIIKNLGIRKKSNSEVSKKIFWEHIVPKLKVGQSKFSKVYIVNLIKEMIGCDIKMALLRKDVDEIKVYANDTSLASQISRKYGAGIHFLIPNIRGVGVGKGKSFCTLEEFEENKLTADNIDYTGYLKELEYFIKPAVTKSIFDY